MNESTDGLSGQDAERLTRSGDDLLDGDRNRGREALIEEIGAAVERIRQEFQTTHLDVVGALEFVKFDELNMAKCEACGECSEENDE